MPRQECERNTHGIMRGMTHRDINKISRSTLSAEINPEKINLSVPSAQVALVFNQMGEPGSALSDLDSLTPAVEA